MSRYKWDELVVLKENKDYPIEQEEIDQYAHYMGLVMPHDEEFLPIVIEALKAPTPDRWQVCVGPADELLYRNVDTRRIQKEHPLDEVYREKLRQLREKRDSIQINDMECIDQASYLNESSGLYRTKLKKSMQQESQLLKDNITQESVYSSKKQLSETSKEDVSVKSQQVDNNTPSWLSVHRLRVDQLKRKVQQFVPSTDELIFSNEARHREIEKLTKRVAENKKQLQGLRKAKEMKIALRKQLQQFQAGR